MINTNTLISAINYRQTLIIWCLQKWLGQKCLVSTSLDSPFGFVSDLNEWANTRMKEMNKELIRKLISEGMNENNLELNKNRNY